MHLCVCESMHMQMHTHTHTPSNTLPEVFENNLKTALERSLKF